MKPKEVKICVYPKDASKITGRTVRASYSLLERIRRSVHKEAHQPVTIKEFCAYMGFVPDDIVNLLTQ
jgi:hypothetical protein